MRQSHSRPCRIVHRRGEIRLGVDDTASEAVSENNKANKMQHPDHDRAHSDSKDGVTPDIVPSASSVSGGAESQPPPPWSSEPFRAFFPLGVAAAILGTVVWPLFYLGWWTTPPHLQHPRLMIFGFGGAFVAGFLGTALPRFVEARPMRTWELSALAASWFAAQLLWLFNHYQFGDLVFALHILGLLAFLGQRVASGSDQPPPGLWIALLGPVMGLSVTCLWAFSTVPGSGVTYALSRLLAWQGMLLLPLMGVGVIFFPRFFPASESENSAPEAASTAITIHFAAGALIVSFFVEACGWVRCGNALRFLAVLLWAWRACPALWRGPAPSTRAWALRLGLGSIALSFLIRVFWPGPGYAMEHLMFIVGFGLVMTLVAERVTLGHSDRMPAPSERSKRWRWFAWLLLLAATTRMSADMKASLITSHHIYAALTWIGVLVAWAAPLLRHWGKSPGSASKSK